MRLKSIALSIRKSSDRRNRKIDATAAEPRALAARLRQHHGALSMEDLAQRLGVELVYASWRTAADQLLYLAECRLDPPRITLNAHALSLVAARSGIASTHLTQLAIAHELYHILTRQPSCACGEVEAAAHLFAEALIASCSVIEAAPIHAANCQPLTAN